MHDTIDGVAVVLERLLQIKVDCRTQDGFGIFRHILGVAIPHSVSKAARTVQLELYCWLSDHGNWMMTTVSSDGLDHHQEMLFVPIYRL